MAEKTVGYVWVHMADNEWSSHQEYRIMENLAREYIERFKHRINDDFTVVVTVHEHGGWWLEYAMIDGELVIVGTANDMARVSERQRAFWEKWGKAKSEYLGTFRRNDEQIRNAG